MTGLILLSMFAFVVLPTMSSYFRGAGAVADPVVATFDGKPLKLQRVRTFTRMHYNTVQFLEKLAEETMRQGGTPQVPGFQYDAQSQQIRSVGINQEPSDLASVRTLQFADAAQKAGFDLDDTAVKNWLARFTAEKFTQQQINGLLARETQNGMGEYHLMDMLRKQLLAEIYQRGALAGIVGPNRMPILTPAEQWQNFLKLNQKATVSAYGLLVSDFIDQTDENPPATEIQAVYQKGKDRYPNSQSPDPGFRRRETATIEYVVGNLKSFVDAEVAKLSDAEIRAEYDKQVAGGAFVMPAEPAKEPEESEKPQESSEEEMKDEPKETPAGKESEKESEDEKQAEQNAAKYEKQIEELQSEIEAAREEMPEKETTEESDSEAEASGEDTNAPDEPADENADETEKAESPENANSDKEDAAEEAESEDEPEAAEQSSLTTGSATTLVLFQDDAKEASETAGSETAEESETASAEASDAAESDVKEETSKEDSEKKTEEDEAPETKIRPFEEVKDQVAESMVQDKARVKLDQAMTKVRKTMKLYFAQKIQFEATKNEDAKPIRPELDKLAESLGLDHETIGPHNVVTIADEPIADSFEVGASFSQRGYPFTVMMFGAGSQVSPLPQFQSLATVDIPAGLSYMSWKVDSEEAFTPPLEDVRDEVVRAIRIEDARELAREEAKKIAEQANGGKKLTELVPEDKKANLTENIAPFSWMNSLGFQGATIGNVPELNSVGDEFMRAVFNAENGDAVVAANLPQDVVYVVERENVQPAIQDLKAIFKQPQERMMAMLLGNEDRGELMDGFYRSIDEETGFDYTPPE